MQAIVIMKTETGLAPMEVPNGVDLQRTLEDCGYTFVGLNTNPNHRAELQGAPKFVELCGPMWDGNRLRYEEPEAYRDLSI